MIVFGDRFESLQISHCVADLKSDLNRMIADPDSRMETATRLLIGLGMMAQGILDREYERRGHYDDLGTEELACSQLLIDAASVYRFALEQGDPVLFLDHCRKIEESLSRWSGDSGLIRMKVPEGFAYYGVYPESYLVAAERFLQTHPEARSQSVVVIGIRSIGTVLAAMVASVVHPELPLITLRPEGWGSDRTVRVCSELERTLVQLKEGLFLVADEGPGMSGGSFSSVADFLVSLGVRPFNIHLFPSHAGLPTQTGDRHPIWTSCERHVCSLEDLQTSHWGRNLSWIDDATPLFTGSWNEAYKYRVQQRARGPIFAKFVGLGSEGDSKVKRARELARRRLIPAVLNAEHGFLFQEWVEPTDQPSREQLLVAVARYLATIQSEFSAADQPGASIRNLHELMSCNLHEALGESSQEWVDRWRPFIDELDLAREPVCIDGRMQFEKWFLAKENQVVKFDALDHHRDHHGIGVQDIAWDLAGARVELDLEFLEEIEIRNTIALLAGKQVSSLLLEFYVDAYVAFHFGRCVMSGRSETEAAKRYRRWIRRRSWVCK